MATALLTAPSRDIDPGYRIPRGFSPEAWKTAGDLLGRAALAHETDDASTSPVAAEPAGTFHDVTTGEMVDPSVAADNARRVIEQVHAETGA